MFRHHTTESLVVHRLDDHPNEIAQRIAAEEIERVLREHGALQ
jgi:hypothetical protein